MTQYIKITKTDALSFFLFIVPLVLIGMAVTPFIFGDITFQRSFGRIGELTTNGSSFYFLIAIVLMPFALFFYIRRIRLIGNVVNNEECVQGSIVNIQFTKDRGYVIYEYEVKKTKYRTTNRIMKHNLTDHLTIGDKVEVCFNDKKPKEAFIKKIYS